MKIAAIEIFNGQKMVGLPVDDGMLNFTSALAIFLTANGKEPILKRSPFELIESGLWDLELFNNVIDFVKNHNLESELLVESEYRLCAPIKRPPAIYALGRNYASHAKEMGKEISEEPIIFGKASTSVIGPEEPVIYPSWITRVDPEAELGVIIMKSGSKIPEEQAFQYIAGYTCINDVTARDIQSFDLSKSQPWFRSKSIDTFCPMGPWILTPDDAGWPVELDIEMRVNGEIRQIDNTRSMVFSIPTIISFISKYITLMPGDIISTGTPEGIKPVNPGDFMEVCIEKIGTLKNPVIGEASN